MSVKGVLAALGVAAISATSASAECATDAQVDAYVVSYMERIAAPALVAGGTLEDALCTQAMLAARLSQALGGVIGYKVGLTSRPAQERFGATEPVRGLLYADMMLEDGAVVPLNFGARPLFEADLVLVVGDAAINAATTAEEAIAHLSEVRPFIELPDLGYAEGEPLTPVTLTANGVGARLGVLGAPIAIEDPQAMLAALAAMTVRVTDANGEVLSEARGAAVLGNPVESVLWLIRNGVTLRVGDYVSVGSIGPLFPPARANGAAVVTYLGLPGDPTVTVRFE